MPPSFLKKAGAAWVTGAGKGIGRALALRLAARGWKVAVSCRTEQDLVTLALEASGLPGTIVPVVLDIVDPVAQSLERKIGLLDLAILNASTHRAVSAQKFDAAVVTSLVERQFNRNGELPFGDPPGFYRAALGKNRRCCVPSPDIGDCPLRPRMGRPRQLSSICAKR